MWTRPRRVCNLGLSLGAQRALGSIYTSLHVAHVCRWVSRSCSKAREDLGSLRAQCTVGAEARECASGDRLRGRGSSQSQTQMRIRLHCKDRILSRALNLVTISGKMITFSFYVTQRNMHTNHSPLVQCVYCLNFDNASECYIVESIKIGVHKYVDQVSFVIVLKIILQ